MITNRYRALWPMEWHRSLITQLCCGVIAVVGSLVALSVCAWIPAGVLALVAFILLEGVSHFRFYWRWVIQVDDSGVSQIGGLGTAGYRASTRWDEVTKWERQRLTGRGRPKVRGQHVYRYTVGAESGPTINWQSNYFPHNDELVQTLIAKLGDAKELPYVSAKDARGPTALP